MSLTILTYIGEVINQLNPGFFDTYAVNGVRLNDGRVIRLDDKQEKEYIGIADNVGSSFYIRVDPAIAHPGSRRISSITTPAQAVKTCRLVAFSFKGGIDSEILSAKLKTDLSRIRFDAISTTSRPMIAVRRSNSHYIDNFLEETRKEAFMSGYSFVCVSVDFELRYDGNECTDCEEFDPNDLYALIVDANDETIILQRLKLGETYPAILFSGIDGGVASSTYSNSLVGGTA